MTTAASSTTTTNPYSALGLSLPATTAGTQTLGMSDFLQLMTAQLQNQDPMNPLSNSDFMSQVAQFSTVQGITQLNSSFSSLSGQLSSSQSLQAASLVGHYAYLTGRAVPGSLSYGYVDLADPRVADQAPRRPSSMSDWRAPRRFTARGSSVWRR